MVEKIRLIVDFFNKSIKDIENLTELNDIKIKLLGKNGEVSNLMKELKKSLPEDRPVLGKKINELRQKIEEQILKKEKILSDKFKQKRLAEEEIDITLDINTKEERGALHPLTLTENLMVDAFIGMGFRIEEGPEVELDYYNFQLLNIPSDHPARDMQDTFYFSDNVLLRTQTSAVQARTMLENKPPIKIICPGKVYRADNDATHSPMFHQLEGLYVGENVTLCDLRGCLDEFARNFFGSDSRTRLRPSYFPFTEPSVEMDVSCFACKGKGCKLCKGTGWIEILGAGIVNPIVLENCGIDSGKYSGFAFGIGIERCAMLKFGIPDIRILFENDLRFLKQFK